MAKGQVLGLIAAAGGVALGWAAPVMAKAAPHPVPKILRDCADGCPAMAVIPAGAFLMGADAGEDGRPEGPVRKVTIRPFAMATLEVTNAQYARFIAETGHVTGTNCRSFVRATGKVEEVPGADFRHPGTGAGEGAANIPVVCVSWRDATAYVAWLAKKTGKPYRLPSEAEWEYAARAGTQGDFPWAGGGAAACTYANVLDADGMADGALAVFGGTGGLAAAVACHDGFAGAAPVGSYPANAFGLHDMVGNVWEWTQDCYYAPYRPETPTDGRPMPAPAAGCDRRAVRGGSWISAQFRNRVSWRGRDPEDQTTWIFGFRVARDVTPAEARSARR
ncbi:SUMF1/EgtB/PvdO family nonheme iron enzyme [Novosphingobium sp. FSY-8]|uniref:SUMF1/EgtB/PvdO family nonheme iron enzyme n=1 Tax=Novosphingobium ovatum TaxID=1908523 RepID=A0ABW9XCC7_9SPHN|nr:formylglycine-generating enzyme family protein [Novosphingobium ovatum]NBC36192.1 SUMF1/EgtB/PvdO family nonheme iron enzyme [Novosphingobium ovatum]